MDIDKSQFSFEAQHLIDLLLSDEWPEAVAPFLICEDNEEDKKNRAEGILDFTGFDLVDKKFLDFGCGEGHVVELASKLAKTAVGYDVVQTGEKTWEDFSGNNILTSNFDALKQFAPFDYVLIYDVLDHCVDPVAVLKKLQTFVRSETHIFLRCHNWMGRHGGHLYKSINKAWIQLVFTEDELDKMGCTLPYLQKYYFPLVTQKKWIEEGGFKVQSEDIIKSNVEQFFKKIEIVSRLPMENFKEFPTWQMSQLFVDYNLRAII
jgi:2-polyprenyl-3-methyl-5-hydroxy-6-metoxy-1,4-benzoquinol methylase